MGPRAGVEYRRRAEDHLHRRGEVAAGERGAAARRHDGRRGWSSRVRDEALDELYATLAGLPGPDQAALLESLVVVPEGARYSELERWRRGPSKPSGPEPGARR